MVHKVAYKPLRRARASPQVPSIEVMVAHLNLSGPQHAAAPNATPVLWGTVFEQGCARERNAHNATRVQQNAAVQQNTSHAQQNVVSDYSI